MTQCLADRGCFSTTEPCILRTFVATHARAFWWFPSAGDNADVQRHSGENQVPSCRSCSRLRTWGTPRRDLRDINNTARLVPFYQPLRLLRTSPDTVGVDHHRRTDASRRRRRSIRRSCGPLHEGVIQLCVEKIYYRLPRSNSTGGCKSWSSHLATELTPRRSSRPRLTPIDCRRY